MAERITHKMLDKAVKYLPQDYTPYGDADRDADPRGWAMDCSAGCKWFAPLYGPLGGDWGVCTNPASHRCGLLTFEHQGCFHFEYDDALDEDETPSEAEQFLARLDELTESEVTELAARLNEMTRNG